MAFLRPRDTVLNVYHRPGSGTPLVFANSLGTDLRIWEAVLASLPPYIPVLAFDKRGHGLSEAGPVSIPLLAQDLADLMDATGLSKALVVGVSVGGMIALQLAADRPDLAAGLVLSNTAHKIGTPEMWATRIGAIEADGIEPIADSVLERWFSEPWRAQNPVALAGYRAMLARQPANGYAAICAAIRDSDLTEAAKNVKVPTLCVGGTADGSTPPEVVRGLADLIDGAEFHCFDGVGHLPCLEVPEGMADLIAGQLRKLS